MAGSIVALTRRRCRRSVPDVIRQASERTGERSRRSRRPVLLILLLVAACGESTGPSTTPPAVPSPTAESTGSVPTSPIPSRPPVRSCGCAVCTHLAGEILSKMPNEAIRLGVNPARGDDAARDALGAWLARSLEGTGLDVRIERGFPGAGRSFDVIVLGGDERPLAVFEIETREEVGGLVASQILQRTREQWIELAEICAGKDPPVALHFVVPADWSRTPAPDWNTLELADRFVFTEEDPALRAMREARGLRLAVWAWGW